MIVPELFDGTVMFALVLPRFQMLQATSVRDVLVVAVQLDNETFHAPQAPVVVISVVVEVVLAHLGQGSDLAVVLAV